MDAEQIEEQLLNALRGMAHGDVFTGASAVDLVQLLRRAARRMGAEGRTSEADVAAAVESLRTFLAEMEKARDEWGLTEFHEETVSHAWTKLCPGFWPFC